MNDAGCHYAAVGSAARALLGEEVKPNDLDVVIGPSEVDRSGVIHALSAVGGRVVRGGRLLPLTSRVPLPWEWSWTASTDLGPVDVITRFIDDTTFEGHYRHAIDVVLDDGGSVRCRPTRSES